MKSNTPKVLHRVAGKPMVFYPVNLLRGMKAGKIVVVVGHGSEEVKAAVQPDKVTFTTQAEQLGTGHAVLCAMKELKSFKGDVLILSGDVPLIRKETVSGLLQLHKKKESRKPVISLVTTVLDNPNGYGRIIRDEHRSVVRIIEDKDCSPLQKKIKEVNTGIYLVSSGFLLANIKKIGKNNAQGEYYLPDLIHLAASQGERVSALTHIDPDEVMGINNRVDLARANAFMRARVHEELMLSGVTMEDPDATYIDYGAKVGMDTVIYPGVRVTGDSVIGSRCVIEDGCRIEGSTIGDDTVVKSYSVIESSVIGKEVTVGPFARLRPGNTIMDKVRIGNFVEVKKTVIGRGSKANHLTYLGDSVIGEGVNIGAGTITCNYDGVNKFQTIIEDGAFIGSDSQLVAPVTVGKGAYVGSGTTVTKNVPPGSLVITRSPEKVIEGWATKKKKVKEKH